MYIQDGKSKIFGVRVGKSMHLECIYGNLVPFLARCTWKCHSHSITRLQLIRFSPGLEITENEMFNSL